ncbi:gluconokinase [Bacillus sp. Marseille-P3661]|uniref:gluconokinase n=1 Tax=Bacillus sp. Marseille-P3661 TaxID=1936234 RepID=UPI000C848539|nr:gluconokinase [Bacillus sp. Marseille-P3661]
MKKYVIGLDVGTTSTKAVVFDKTGNVISECESEYPLTHPKPSWAEQDAHQIELAAITAIKTAITKAAITKEELIAVGISSAMHSIICVDRNNKPLSPSITWADGRSTAQAQALKGNNIGLPIYLKTGTPIHPMSPLLKLIWMKETNYEPYLNAYKFISIKEYLIASWFGEYVVDYSVAAATGMLDIFTRDWNSDALEQAGISVEQLSKVVPAHYTMQGMNKQIADQMGIPVNLPFVIGGSDGPLANLGIGAINKGEVAITIGTSGAIRQMTNKPKTDEEQEVFCYSFTDDLWIMGGPTNNGGIVLRWIKETLGQHEVGLAQSQGLNAYDLLTTIAEKIPVGSNGLLFMPHLNGERAPFWDAKAKGAYIGLTSSHQRDHMIRAGLEGVIFSIFHIGEALERLAGEPSKIYASGGFARSSLWLQILCDVFGKEVHVPESHQSSAWGAAWIALCSVGESSSLIDIKDHIPMKMSLVPKEENHRKYAELYNVYRSLYQSLRASFVELHRIQNQ